MKNSFLLLIFCFIFLLSCRKTNVNHCCTGTGQLAAVDSSAIAMPDVFTPNGDGINDQLRVLTKNISSLKLTITRRNKIVFETFDLSAGWDGTHSGKNSKEREYSYEVMATTINGQSLSLSGDICIIRDNCAKGNISDCFFSTQFNGSSFDKNLPSGESINMCN